MACRSVIVVSRGCVRGVSVADMHTEWPCSGDRTVACRGACTTQGNVGAALTEA